MFKVVLETKEELKVLKTYIEDQIPGLMEKMEREWDAPGLIPLILFLYAVYKDYTITFEADGGIRRDPECETDRVFCQMVFWYNRHHDFYGGEPYTQKAFEKMKEARTQAFLEETFPALLEGIEHYLHDFGYEDVIDPLNYHEHLRIAKTIAASVNSLEIKSVFDTDKTYLTASRYVSKGIQYTADFRVEVGNPENLRNNFTTFAPIELVYLAAVQLACREDRSCMQPTDWEMPEKSDAIIVYGGSRFLKDVVEIAESRSARYVVMRIFSSKRLYGEQYLVGKHLMQVDHIDNSDWYNLVFDLKEHYSSIKYRYGKSEDGYLVREVPYTEIHMFHDNLNTEIYVHPPLEEGMELRRLNELAAPAQELVVPEIQPGDRIPTYNLSSQFDVICSPLYRPMMAPFEGESKSPIWSGKNLHIGSSLRQCISHTDGFYSVDGDVDLSLQVNEDIVSTEYLAYVLGNSEMFRSFMRLGLHQKHIMHYRIPVFCDRQKQNAIVRQALEQLRSVVNSDGVYSVICVGDSLRLEGQEKIQLENWNVVSLAYAPSVYGEGGLIELLEDKTFAKRVEAILVDPMTDASGTRLKGLQRTLLLGRQLDIPVFAYSNVPLSAIAEDLEEEDFRYINKGHYYEAGAENSLRRFVTRVRDVLDNDGTLSQQIRMRHVLEFKAAAWIRDNWNIDVPTTLLDALASPNKHLPQVRESVESLLKKIASIIAPETSLDQTKGGWLAKFFLYRAREDNEKTHKFYVLEGKPMEKTLATSVDFMYQILNGASHGGESIEEAAEMNVLPYIESSGTQNIAMSVLHIYMEFIVWIAGTGGQFNAKCVVKNSKDEIASLNIPGVVRRVNAGEYYIETQNPEYQKIHFWPGRDNPIPEGTTIVLNAITEETKDKGKYKWFASKWTIPDKGD